jgi:hypothetical protein
MSKNERERNNFLATLANWASRDADYSNIHYFKGFFRFPPSCAPYSDYKIRKMKDFGGFFLTCFRGYFTLFELYNLKTCRMEKDTISQPKREVKCYTWPKSNKGIKHRVFALLSLG